jgi:hypothetical protein
MPKQTIAAEVTPAEVSKGDTLAQEAGREINADKLGAFLNEHANTDARRRAMQREIEGGIDGLAFVEKFYGERVPELRRKYIARRVDGLVKGGD